MLEDYTGKKFRHCYSMGQRLNFNQDGSISLCHGIEVGDYIVDRRIIGKRLNKKWFEKKIGAVVRKSYKGQNSFCENCSNYINETYSFEGLKVITINTSNQCNCKCIYCTNWAAINRNKNYDPLPYIKDLEKEGLISKHCMFDWGGGEPTLNKYFESTVIYIASKGYAQRVNTNAVTYSDFLRDAICKGYCTIRTSLDAGDIETFYNVKGFDAFGSTCQNIRKYASGNEKSICVKYVLNRANRNIKSIRGFLDFCKEIGVTDIILDADLNSYSHKYYSGPLFFTSEELKSAYYFIQYAKSLGLSPKVGYVYTANQDIVGRDYNNEDNSGTLQEYNLPMEVPKNKSNNLIMSNGLAPEAYASVEAIIANVGNSAILLEDGLLGKIMKKELVKRGVNVKGTIQFKSEDKVLARQFLSEKEINIPIIICSIRNNTIVQKINKVTKKYNIPVDAVNIISIDPYRVFWGNKFFDFINLVIKFCKYTIYRESNKNGA